MALVWIFPSIGALVILGMSTGGTTWSLEKMLAGVILMIHSVLVYRWLTSKKNK